MKTLIKSAFLGFLLASPLMAITVDGYERNHSTLADQRSPNNFVHIEDAYISYKYVGGLVLLVTFSVPNLAYDKEFYFLRNQSTNDSVKARFARSKQAFYYGGDNAIWLGRQNGRDRFLMRVSGIFNPNGPYAIYAKLAGRNIPGFFTLK